jgi:hypothetical protein
MTDRYSLRIETGGRAGELVPLSNSPFLIGRSQECNLRLTEASVSGRHAELRIKGELISLHDLGSTNGTRIGRLKIGEAELEVGLAFSVGDVRLTLQAESAQVAAPPASKPEPELESDEISLEEPDQEPYKAPTMASGSFAAEATQTKIQPGWDASLGSDEILDEAGHVSADQLARASRRSPVALAGLAVLILAAGGAFYFFGQGAGEGKVAPAETTPVGDLLRGAGTFEESANSPWSSRDGWNGLFRRTRSAAAAGVGGLTCELLAGERAQHMSPITKVTSQQAFEIGASVRVEGDAIARLGLRWFADEAIGEDAAPTVQATIAWGPVVSTTEGFQEYSLKGTAPAGYSQAQVCIAAWGKGELQEGEDAVETVVAKVDVDSVTWLETGTGEAAVTLHEMRGFVQGDPGTSFVLHKIDRILLSGVQCLGERPGYDSLPVEIAARAHDHGMLLSRTDGGAGQWFFTASPRAVAGGVSTMGTSGYLARSLEFEDPEVTDLVLGSGTDLIRISFDSPVLVSGGARSGSYRFSVQVPKGMDVLVKTEFGDELKAAVDLAADARLATREGRVGAALTLWKQLLDRYPYEAEDVARADAARSTLLRDGRSSVKTLKDELERARFFQLRTGFDGCWEVAQVLKQRYAGSDLEAPLNAILEDIQTARAQFREEGELGADYREALIHVLREQGANGLASQAQASEPTTNNKEGH